MRNAFFLVLWCALAIGAPLHAQTNSSSDILQQLNKVGTLQARSAGLKDPGLPSPDALLETQVQGYYAAINYHAALGNTNRVIELYRELVKIADRVGGNTAAQARSQLAGELGSAGYQKESLALREESKPFFAASTGVRIANLGSIARTKIQTFNDLEGAQKDLQDMESELKSASASAREPEFVNIWLAGFEWAKAVDARARGRYAESVAYYRGAADRYLRYANNVDDLVRRYKYNDRRDGVLNARDFVILESAHSLRWMGRAVEAETTLRQLLADQINRGARPSNIAVTASALSLTLMNQGRWQEAEKVQLKGIEILRDSGLPATSLRHSQARGSLVPIYIGMGKWKESFSAYTEAYEQAVKIDAASRRNFLWPEMTIVFLKLGKVQEAHDHAKRVLEIESQRFGPNSFRVKEAEGFLAMTLKAQGKRDEAERLFRASASRILDPNRDLSGSGAAFLRVKVRHIIEDYLDLLAGGLKLPHQSNIDDATLQQAFWMSEAVRGSTVQRAISGAAARFATADNRLSTLVRREQDLAIAAADLQRKIGELYSGRLPIAEAQTLATGMRRQIDQFEQERKQAIDTITRDFPSYAELVRPRSPSLRQISEILAPNEAYVSIYAGLSKTYVTAIRSDGRAAFHVAGIGESEIATMVATLRRSLDPGDVPLGKIPPFDFAVAHRLYQQLLGPLGDVGASAPIWTLSTTGALGSLPFALLTTAPFKATPDARLLFAEYKSAPWLNQRVALAYSPSAAATLALRRLPAGSVSRKTFFGIGDPQFGQAGTTVAAASRALPTTLASPTLLRNLKIPRALERNLAGMNQAADRVSDETPSVATRSTTRADSPSEPLPDIPPLPDTRDEILAIAASLGANPNADTLFGAEATRDRVKGLNLQDRKIVAFATHGLIPGDMPGLTQPALTMAYTKDPRDSLLTLEDILKLKLDADWVILSACNTGAADGLGGEASSGLGRGFFYAGSRALLLTHWPVESESARRLVTEIFSRYSKNTSRAQSVREAADALIASPGYLDPASNKLLYSYAHPMFWAPYTLIGDSR